jgi:hypothetical protein
MIKNRKRAGLFIGIGMILGYLYHAWVGCDNGGCLISSNPYISTIYGGLMGWLLFRSGSQDTIVKEAPDSRVIR